MKKQRRGVDVVSGTFKTFDEMTAYVQRYMDHPFLSRNTISQSISRFHFEVLQVMLQSAGVAAKDAIQVMTSILLLHQGLSIHEEVDSNEGLNRQLIVLAGDYDSSLYYFVLAKLGDSVLLSKLCEAVVAVNEAKMTLYDQSESLSDDSFWSLRSVIEGSLIHATADHYLHHDLAELKPMLDALVLTYVIHDAMVHQRLSAAPHLSDGLLRMNAAVNRIKMSSGSQSHPPRLYSHLVNTVSDMCDSVRRFAQAEGL